MKLFNNCSEGGKNKRYIGFGFGAGILLSGVIILVIGLVGGYSNMFSPYMGKNNRTVGKYNFAFEMSSVTFDKTQLLKEVEYSTKISATKFSVSKVLAYGPRGLAVIQMQVFGPVASYVLDKLGKDDVLGTLAGIGVLTFFRDPTKVPGLDVIRSIDSSPVQMINSGGLAYVGTGNQAYVADSYFVGTSGVYANPLVGSVVLSSIRLFTSTDGGYDIPVSKLSSIPSILTLTFAEIQVQAAGQRIFSPVVTVDGVEVYRFIDLDVINEANGFAVPVNLNVNLKDAAHLTTNSKISLRFLNNVGTPMINAIELY